jgi:hypothetical protein
MILRITKLLSFAIFGFITFAPSSFAGLMLPEDFIVYVTHEGEKDKVSTKPPGTPIILPTRNQWIYSDGCYIECNTADKAHAVFNNMAGVIRVEGSYENHICTPKGLSSKTIEKDARLSKQCERAFPARCKADSCTIDGKNTEMYLQQ